MKKLLTLCCLFLLLLSSARAEDFSALYPGAFLAEGEAPVVTGTSYRSANMFFNITSQRYGQSDVYVADILLRDLSCFQRVYGGSGWDTSKNTVSHLAEQSGAVLALTGDSSYNLSAGWVVGNGRVERDGVKLWNTVRDLCVIYRNGEMRTIVAPTMEQNRRIAEEIDNVWHTLLFGPALLDENVNAFPSFEASASANVSPANPRAALGYYGPGHYCFVQVDGRGTKSALEPSETNRGLTLTELSELMASLSCQAAYNLDGGRSAMLWFNGSLVSTPSAADRRVGDILILREPAEK